MASASDIAVAPVGMVQTANGDVLKEKPTDLEKSDSSSVVVAEVLEDGKRLGLFP